MKQILNTIKSGTFIAVICLAIAACSGDNSDQPAHSDSVVGETAAIIENLTWGLPIALAIGIILGLGIMLIIKRCSKKKSTKAKLMTLTISDKSTLSFLKNHSVKTDKKSSKSIKEI